MERYGGGQGQRKANRVWGFVGAVLLLLVAICAAKSASAGQGGSPVGAWQVVAASALEGSMPSTPGLRAPYAQEPVTPTPPGYPGPPPVMVTQAPTEPYVLPEEPTPEAPTATLDATPEEESASPTATPESEVPTLPVVVAPTETLETGQRTATLPAPTAVTATEQPWVVPRPSPSVTPSPKALPSLTPAPPAATSPLIDPSLFIALVALLAALTAWLAIRLLRK